MIKAVYPGSFDPPTLGHVNILQRISPIFEKIIVAVAVNPAKTPLFSVEERIYMMKEIAKNFNNVEVDHFSGLLVEYVKKIGAKVVIRGLRELSDFEFEFRMALANRSLAPEIETMFLMTDPAYSFVSSSVVKEIKALGGDISKYVPDVVLEVWKRKK